MLYFQTCRPVDPKDIGVVKFLTPEKKMKISAFSHLQDVLDIRNAI